MKLYFLGLGACAAKIIFAPQHAGRWPHIEELARTSLYGPSDCEPGLALTGPSWMSIYTGQPAAVHGVTDPWGRPVHGSRAFRSVREPFIWDILNRAGLTCGLVTLPLVFPAYPIDGFMIAGSPSPRLSVSGNIAVPADFPKEDSQAIREAKPIPGPGVARRDEIPLEATLALLQAAELKKAALVPELLRQHPVDCLFVQYACLARVGHALNDDARRGQGYDPRHALEMYDWFDSELLPRALEIEADALVVTSELGWRNLAGRGEHDPQGVFMARGAEIAQGLRIACRNIDVLPTVLDILGLPPSRVAGRSVLVRQGELDQANQQLAGLGYI